MKNLIPVVALLILSQTSFAQDDVKISIPGIHANSGDVINYPIDINPNGNIVSAVSFSLYYDPVLIESIEFTARSGWSLFSNLNEAGRVRVSGFKMSGEASIFTIGTVSFNVIGGPNTVCPMSLDITALADDQGINLTYQLYNGSVYIDISQNGNCNIVDGPIEGIFNGSLNFDAPMYLTSPAVGNQTLIQTGASIEMKAGNYVELNPGFLTEAGSIFYVDIDQCNDPMTFIEDDERQLKGTIDSQNEIFDNSLTKMKTDISIYPNPFSGYAQIDYWLSVEEEVSVIVLDEDGKQIKKIEENVLRERGKHSIAIHADDLTTGIQLLQLVTSTGICTSKFYILD